MYKIFRIDLLFWLIVFILAFLVAYSPAFGIIDDHSLTTTLLIGKNIPFFIMPDIGRYYPLDAQELNVLTFLFSPSPKVFYVFNALCLILVAILLVKTFYIFFSPYFKNVKSVSYIAVLIILVSPAFLTSWLRLFVPERMEFVFLSIFLYSYAVLYTRSTRKYLFYSCVCVCSSLIALFYKETAFILIGAFAFFHIVFRHLSGERIFKIDVLLLLNCLIWIACYIFFVILQKNTQGVYGDSPYNRLFVFLKDFVIYSLNDPLATAGVFSCLVFRILMVGTRQIKINPLYDSMLIASGFFVLSYIYLGISNVHYLLPAYIFVIPCIFITLKTMWNLFSKILVCVTTIVFLLNCIPLSLYSYMNYRFGSQNFQNMLFYLQKYQGNKNVYLEGVNRASGGEVYVSLSEWVNFYKIKNFDLLSDIPIDRVDLWKEDPKSIYTAFRNSDISKKKKGDLVVLLSYNGLNVTYSSIQEMKKKYKLLFVADAGWNTPLFGLRPLAKWVGIWLTKGRDDFSFNHNIFGLPIYVYVFEVK